MNDNERKMLDLSVQLHEQVAEMLETLANQVSNLEDRLAASSVTLSESVVKTSISTLLISEIFAELSDGNREKLDEILTRSTSLAESILSEKDDVASGHLQAAFDEIISSAEAAFGRRRLLNDRQPQPLRPAPPPCRLH